MSQPVSRPIESISAPRVWVLISDKIGDDSQSLLVANALGWPFEVRKMVFGDSEWRWYDRLRGPTLRNVAVEDSAALAPPWPDLVISAGRLQVPVVTWIKQQSGGRTRLVQFNRPLELDAFDLVIAPPQLRVPPRRNVLNLRLALQRRDDPERLEAAGLSWQSRFAGRPKPWVAAMVGGPAWPFSFDPAAAGEMMRRLQAYADGQNGSLLVTTSRRTPEAAIAAMVAEARPQDFVYRWDSDPETNPYFAFLALADQFVVTGDSASMLTEVIRLGRPLAIYDMPKRWSLRKRVKSAVRSYLHGSHLAEDRIVSGLRGVLSDSAHKLGIGYQRDFEHFHRGLVRGGWASYFGAPIAPPSASPPDDLPIVVERIRRLMAEAGHDLGSPLPDPRPHPRSTPEPNRVA
ncbi:mitochondrial fission ELM1 family protein [Algihabitans albus]|uniref:mitochondrial fission ELM1 family protein n=1 Tax=Algihabitans albus TaxID=2164067 RepID=UPI000E5D62EC|nr:ELM1/GtrOC1 family putative glycosyltransferase [Algihabitans albus]